MGATLQGRQPAFDMSVLERLQGRTSGKFYVVVHGSRGTGFFGDWSTCGVTGCSGAAFQTFEFNQKSSGGKKYTSFAACEAEAIDYMLTPIANWQCAPSFFPVLLLLSVNFLSALFYAWATIFN